MNRKQIDAFYEGMKAGIRRFSWWRFGREVVGCGVLTLKEALEEIEKMKTDRLNECKRENAKDVMFKEDKNSCEFKTKGGKK